MKLVVGFITYNEISAKYLADFLPSLAEALSFLDRADFKIFAHDNSDSLNQDNKLIIDRFNLSAGNLIEYSSLNNNLGFARAYNILLNYAYSDKAEYFLALNPDMIMEPDSIKKLIAALDLSRDVSALSPKIYYWDFLNKKKTKLIDSLGLIVRPGLRFYDLGQGNYDQGQFDGLSIIGPSGAAGLFRLSALDKISFVAESGRKQYFDERFFMYKEDCDLAYRLSLANFKSKLVPDSIFYHNRTSGSGRQNVVNKLWDRLGKSRQVRIWSLENQNILYAKYWKKENFVNKLLIIFWFTGSFIFSLILEQFNLKTYFKRK